MTDKELSDFIEHGENGFQEFAIAFGYAWASMAIQIAKELRTRQRESRIDKMINQQKKEWAGLTDKEVVMLAYQSQENECTAIRLAEAKLKEKNT
jgi:hypothetical protein